MKDFPNDNHQLAKGEKADPSASKGVREADLKCIDLELEGMDGEPMEGVSISDNLPYYYEKWHECVETMPSLHSPPPPPQAGEGHQATDERWNFIMNKLINIENNTCNLSREFKIISSKVDGQAIQINEVKAATGANEQKINALHRKQDSLTAEIDEKMEQKFRQLESALIQDNAEHQAAIKKEADESTRKAAQEVKDVILQEQCDRRRLNLLLIGLQEEEGENLGNVVSSFFTKRMSLPDIDVTTAYRLGKPGGNNSRPTLVRFAHMAHRQRVWFSKSKIKTSKDETKVWIHEDLPKAVKHVQRTYFKILKKAKSLEGQFVGAHIKGQSLVVDGKTYGENDLETLPEVLRPSSLATLQSEGAVAFFGRSSPLSNHHPSPFNIDGNNFSCMEQFLAWRRATVADDQLLIAKALSKADPLVYKGILNDNKPEEWKDQLEVTALAGIRAKFHQNPPLANFLCSTYPKAIGEASLNKRWGTGFTLTHPKALESGEWSAEGNLLGKTLMAIREELMVTKNA